MRDDARVTAADPTNDTAADETAAREPSPAGPWACPRCGSERTAGDDYCGRCGARRAITLSTPDQTSRAAKRDGFPVARALILNGVILVAVILAVVLGGNGGPGVIGFEPSIWRCNGSERTWTAMIPARSTDLLVEWRTNGPVGELRATTETSRQALERFAMADGSFRVTTSEPGAPECGLTPGTWTLAIRDASDNALLAAGDVVLVAP